MSKKYIHYGHKKFDRRLFAPVKNGICFSKPEFGGLWASPVDAEFGWKDWCDQEKFRECDENNSFKFVLSENANIIHIYKVGDLGSLPKLTDQFGISLDMVLLDFEKLVEQGVDAVELHLSEEDHTGVGYLDGLYWRLYGWDCDSILIMNPDIVEEVAR